jgi:xanthine/uracil permease
VAVTGVKSRYVVATGGLFLVTLGLLPVMGRVIAAVPTAVLGGAGLCCSARWRPAASAPCPRSTIATT